MTKKKSYLAVDMGASGGRHLLGHFDGQHLSIEEVYRFDNGPVNIADSFYWNLPGLWTHVQHGMAAAREHIRHIGGECVSVGVDTWGVDFALLGNDKKLLGNPRSYRDPHTDGIFEKAFATVPKSEIFAQTGLQFMQFNSLFQLLAMRLADSPLLEVAAHFLMIPDLFHWLLSGEMGNEKTNASTTQFYNPVSQTWAADLLQRFQLPTAPFIPSRLMEPGTTLGKLRCSVAVATGFSDLNVVLPCTHDTGSAVLAVPSLSTATVPDWCYISLGTWAPMGFESKVPIINDTVLSLNFTNEGGVGNTSRILKNICGMWLIQECRRTWNHQGRRNITGHLWDWEDLNRMTAAAPILVSLIDPDSRDFLTPTDMPAAIREFCRRTRQPIPETEGAVLRCALDSIALKARLLLGHCEQISGSKMETIHIVGGGTKNVLLCQAIADACGRRVVSGPVEATATGNLLMQAIANGDLHSVTEARQLVHDSLDVVEITPANEHRNQWNDAFERFLSYTAERQ